MKSIDSNKLSETQFKRDTGISCPTLYLIAENILDDICAQKIDHNNSSIADYLTVCIGLTVYEGQYEMSDTELLKIADQALYLANHQGRDRYRVL